MAPIKVAVLDDYKGHAEPAFAKLDPADFDVTYFPETLRPYDHEATTPDEKHKLVERLKPFQVISTMRERTAFPAELVEKLPNLKLLLTTGMKNRGLDLDAFKTRGIPVIGTSQAARAPVSGPDSTTQHFVALVLAAARNVAANDLSVKTGGWQTGPAPVGLAGKVYATVGLGRLGASTAKILHQSFGMKVVAWSPSLTQERADDQARLAGLPVEDSRTGEKTFRVVSRQELFRSADVLAVHIVLSDRTRGLITAADLALLSPHAIFVNSSRGPIVVEDHLLDLLRRGKILAAALDVFEIEPLPADSPWRSTKWGRDGSSEVLLTPHLGYGERETMDAWYVAQAASLVRWKQGLEPENRLV